MAERWKFDPLSDDEGPRICNVMEETEEVLIYNSATLRGNILDIVTSASCSGFLFPRNGFSAMDKSKQYR